MRARLALLGLLAVLSGFAAPAGAGTGEAVLRAGHPGEPDSLDPHAAVSAPSFIVINDLFEGLLTLDAHGRAVAGAAEGYTVAADGRVYTFTLRRGLSWSDGRALDATDFVYSFRRLADPATGSTNLASYIDLLKGGRSVVSRTAPPESLGVSAPDPRTVRIELEHPAPYFPIILALPVFSPVPRQAIERSGRSWTRPGNFVGNGPFMLSEWIPNGYVKAVRNPRFHAAAEVHLDAVIYRPIADLNTGLRLFETGELDTVTNFPPEKLDSIRASMPGALHLAPSLGVTVYVFNHRSPKFRDVRVRQALSLAIDREAITSRIVRAGDQPALGLVTPGIAGHLAPRAAAAPSSPAARVTQAKGLLAAAGFGPDHPLEVELLHPTSEEHQKVAVAVASMWQAIGVKTKLRNAERQIVEVATRDGEFEIVRAAWFSPYADASGFLSFLRAGSAANASGYSNPAFEALMSQAEATGEAAARERLLTHAEQTLLEDQAVIPLYFLVSRRLVGPRVLGWYDDNPTAFRPARWLSLRPRPETRR